MKSPHNQGWCFYGCKINLLLRGNKCSEIEVVKRGTKFNTFFPAANSPLRGLKHDVGFNEGGNRIFQIGGSKMDETSSFRPLINERVKIS